MSFFEINKIFKINLYIKIFKNINFNKYFKFVHHNNYYHNQPLSICKIEFAEKAKNVEQHVILLLYLL